MDIWTEQLELCRTIAENAHIGQVRRGGDSYIHHPCRVASQFNGVDACVAWLHDVIEDTDETAESLAARGVDDRVISGVVTLTKQYGQDYLDYLSIVRRHRIARRVKIADMLDNLCDNPTSKQRGKYRHGILWLAI